MGSREEQQRTASEDRTGNCQPPHPALLVGRHSITPGKSIAPFSSRGKVTSEFQDSAIASRAGSCEKETLPIASIVTAVGPLLCQTLVRAHFFLADEGSA